jgi:hypothetical protein
MKAEDIFYTDGQAVFITSSTLQVGDKSYSLKAIKESSMAVVPPERGFGMIIFLTGVLLALFGMADGIPSHVAQGLVTARGIDLNEIAQWTGLGFTLLGLVFSVMLREKYAVRIANDEGELDAIVSSRREYIQEILDALNRVVLITDTNANRELRRA